MKRTVALISVFTLLMATLFSIASCGGTPATVAEPEPVAAAAPAPVVVAGPEPVVEVASPPPPPPSLPDPPPEPEPVADPVEEVDTSPPTLSITLSPIPFSPDGDGIDDTLTVTINIETKSEINAWHIIIREPRSPYNIFSEWSGQGMPPTTIVWDGKSASGELVQSASDYPFSLSINNIYGAETVYQGNIAVDILVMVDGNVRRIIVPSIVFAANTGDFSNLDANTMADNDYILRSVAEALRRFPNHNILVEGHANPTTAPGTAERTREEQGTRTEIGLQQLSEERAKAVQDYLINLGIDASRLSFRGMGGTQPAVAYEEREEWWKNRRVEFILTQ